MLLESVGKSNVHRLKIVRMCKIKWWHMIMMSSSFSAGYSVNLTSRLCSAKWLCSLLAERLHAAIAPRRRTRVCCCFSSPSSIIFKLRRAAYNRSKKTISVLLYIILFFLRCFVPYYFSVVLSINIRDIFSYKMYLGA